MMSVLIAATLSAVVARADDADRMRQLLSEACRDLRVSQAVGLLLQSPPSPARSAGLWTDIGAAQAKLGDAQAAHDSFDQAWKTGATIKGEFQRIWGVLAEAARAQAEAGQFRDAVDHARGFANTEERWDLFLNIAWGQEMRRDFAGSRQTLIGFPHPDAKAEAQILVVIASSYAFEGNFPEALVACDRIEADFKWATQIYPKIHNGSMSGLTAAERSIVERVGAKRSAVSIVSTALNRVGRFEEARQVVQRLKGDPSLERYIRYIAQAAADAGQLALAQKCFGELAIRWRTGDVTRSLVAALAKAGRFQEAADLIDGTQDRTEKALAIFTLATEYARRGDERSVQRQCDRVMALTHGSSGLGNNGQRKIIAGFVSGGHIAKAVTFAERIRAELANGKPKERAERGSRMSWEDLSEIYQGIAAAAARRGKTEDAKRLFDHSHTAEMHSSRNRWMLRRLVQLAVAEADAGFREKAVECLGAAFDLAGQIDVTDSTADELIQLAAAQAALGQQKLANHTLSRSIKFLSQQVVTDSVTRSLQDLARAQAWVGDADDAVRSARDQSTHIVRASMDVGIVQGMLARREGKVLLEKPDPLGESGLKPGGEIVLAPCSSLAAHRAEFMPRIRLR